MTNENNPTEKKKLSLQELMKQQLAAKKQGKNNSKMNYSTATKVLKNQQTKKANNQSRRTGV